MSFQLLNKRKINWLNCICVVIYCMYTYALEQQTLQIEKIITIFHNPGWTPPLTLDRIVPVNFPFSLERAVRSWKAQNVLLFRRLDHVPWVFLHRAEVGLLGRCYVHWPERYPDSYRTHAHLWWSPVTPVWPLTSSWRSCSTSSGRFRFRHSSSREHTSTDGKRQAQISGSLTYLQIFCSHTH